MGIKSFIVKKYLAIWEKRDSERLRKQSFPDGIKEIADIPYINDGTEEHFLDIYYPEKFTGRLPVIIDIHGGGLVYGGKHLKRIYDGFLSKEGFIVFNINYRLAWDGVTVFEQIKDVAAALKWISAHMDGYSADKDRVFITGDSAGAFLAALITLISKSGRLQKLYGTGDIGLTIKAAGLISGMLYFDKKSLPLAALRSMCLPKKYKNADLYKNLVFKDLPEITDFPPLYLVSSDEDVLRGMTRHFVKVLSDMGIPHKFTYLKKEKGGYFGHVHSVMYPESKRGKIVNAEMIEFFRQNM